MDIENLLNQYGSYTFSDDIMRERLPKSIYGEFHKSLDNKEPLSKECASAIANAMKIWAIEKGATHFTHWFIPLTGVSAEKHDAFFELDGDKIVLEFSGKLLRKGESDASSFPSGGLRATFEARGYTSWDCTSCAFVKDNSLYIPTLFCSYTGEALDYKTPLLKSCEILNDCAVQLLQLLGEKEISNVTSFVGCEQEYFLISDELYQKRLDLKLTGRTLFGAKPSKGQELDDFYLRPINSKVSKFMEELDRELWRFGIPSKTKHHEAAPSQHEIACIYRKANITSDNNYLLMQLMQDIAERNGLRCLLHEKPFSGINGSGKHNNWSIVTNNGVNLFSPGDNPIENLPFLTVLACLIKGIDEYSDLLRLSIAGASNDHRLGGDEAPPSIISVFLGDRINQLIDSIINDERFEDYQKERFQTGIAVIPDFSKDNTDRNRTSPFAFTGNKFEFRGVGSSQSIANVNTMLNSILAYEMKLTSLEIQKGRSPKEIIKEYFIRHKRIIYEGDGYSLFWQQEAKRRNLPLRKDTIEAIECLKNPETIKPLIELEILSKEEINSRYEVLLDIYSKTIQVESLTSLKMAKNDIFPCGVKYLNLLCESANNLRENQIENKYLIVEIKKISNLLNEIRKKINNLDKMINKVQNINETTIVKAKIWRDDVLSSMNKLRKVVDVLETKVDRKYWPYPSYSDLLFGI